MTNTEAIKCEKCGDEKASFVGNCESEGMSPKDCENIQENLPGGFAWLCEDCDHELWLDAMETDDEENKVTDYPGACGCEDYPCCGH